MEKFLPIGKVGNKNDQHASGDNQSFHLENNVKSEPLDISSDQTSMCRN